jgi:AcrR family transcriptional regulator
MVVKQTRREEILDAMLDLVVERGFNDAPMSELSKRSGASAGIIYHYFENKDDIIEQLYKSIIALKGKSLTQNLVAGMATKDAFVLVWKNAYNFWRKHEKEGRFLAQYENLPCFIRPELRASMMEDPNYAFLVNSFKPKTQGGFLKDLPIDVLAELSIGVAGRLANQPEELSPDVLSAVAEICWQSVAAE